MPWTNACYVKLKSEKEIEISNIQQHLYMYECAPYIEAGKKALADVRELLSDDLALKNCVNCGAPHEPAHICSYCLTKY